MIHVVTYVYDPNAAEEIQQIRPAHREFLTDLHDRGVLRASGPWVGEVAGAYLLMATATPEEALAALDPDPLEVAGLIAQRSVQAWNPVIGDLA